MAGPMNSAPVDLSLLPPPAKRALAPGAPVPMQMMAAKAILPGVKPAELVTVVAALTTSDDPRVSEAARTTLGQLPPPLLDGALAGDLEPIVTEVLAEFYAERADVVERLLRMPRLSSMALQLMAERADEQRGEIVATNEQLLLANPAVIEKLYLNPRVRMSTSDRLLELAVRNGLELELPAFKEAAAAIQNELVAEATGDRTPDDELFLETDRIARGTGADAEESAYDVDDEGEEQLRGKFRPLYAQLAQMTVTQKIRRAILGTGSERLILVRDSNRLVSTAAIKSPMLKENEAIMISSSRSVGDDVLRILSRNREMTRSYQVKMNLVTNPRTPFTFASGFIPLLRDNDLKLLAKSKNVSGNVSQAARRQLLRKQGKAKK